MNVTHTHKRAKICVQPKSNRLKNIPFNCELLFSFSYCFPLTSSLLCACVPFCSFIIIFFFRNSLRSSNSHFGNSVAILHFQWTSKIEQKQAVLFINCIQFTAKLCYLLHRLHVFANTKPTSINHHLGKTDTKPN